MMVNGRRGTQGWQVDGKSRSLSELAVYFNMTAMLLHDAVHLSQPQPGAFIQRFGGKEARKFWAELQGRCLFRYQIG